MQWTLVKSGANVTCRVTVHSTAFVFEIVQDIFTSNKQMNRFQIDFYRKSPVSSAFFKHSITNKFRAIDVYVDVQLFDSRNGCGFTFNSFI